MNALADSEWKTHSGLYGSRGIHRPPK